MGLKPLKTAKRNMVSNIKDDLMSILPKGWVWTTLDDILLTFESGGRPKGGVRHIKTGIPSIGGEHLNSNGGFDFMKMKYVPSNFYESMNTGRIQKDDILVVKDGATTGKTSIVRDDFPCEKAAVNEHVFLVRPFKEINNLYLFYYLFSAYGQEYVRKNFKGTAQGGINLTFAKNTYVPLAPTNEQHRIAAKIEELFTKLDAGIAALKKIKAQLKRYRQAVLKHAFEGKLTEKWRAEHKNRLEPASFLLKRIKEERKQKGKYKKMPPLDTSYLPELSEGWTWIKFEDIGEVNPRFSKEGIVEDIEVTFLPMRRVEELTGKMDLSITKKLSKVMKGYTPFRNGDLLFAKITPCMENGKVAIADKLTNDIGFGSTEFHVIRLSEEVPREFFFYYITQESFRKEAKRKMKGTAGQLRVPADYIRQVPIPCASLHEQSKIIEEIECRFSTADDIEKTIDLSLRQADRLKQSILKRAFEGKLVPQDTNDEPASELLERIRAEKAKHLDDNRMIKTRR